MLAKRAGAGGKVGSPNTIQVHLMAWRERDRPLDSPVPTPQLPPSLVADIGRALTAAAAASREKVEQHLAATRLELAELAAAGEAQDAQIQELAEVLVVRTTERDTVVGRMGELEAELAQACEALRREQTTSEGLRLEFARAQLSVESAAKRVEESRHREQTQGDELGRVREELAGERIARSDVEKHLSGTEAWLESKRASNATLEAAATELRSSLARVVGVEARASGAEAEAAGLREQVALLERTASMLQSLVTKGAGVGGE